jgi:hypothetical protein
MIGAPLYGIISGAVGGKKEMTVEYNEAEEQQRVSSVQKGVSRQRTEPTVEHPVPERTQSHLQEQQARRSANTGISAPLPS